MAPPREWADVLRALGRSLEEQQATHVEIMHRNTFLAVYADVGTPGRDRRAYEEHDLELLRKQAREMRSGTGGNPGGSLAELLRTLGQELDLDEVDLSRIAEVDLGWEVSGEGKGKYYRKEFSRTELMELSAQRRAARPTGIALLSRVSLGAAVYTKDEHRIGKLKEIRGNFFQIGTPFLQRDYWLPGDCVASAGPDERVLLWVSKGQVDGRKTEGDPPRG